MNIVGSAFKRGRKKRKNIPGSICPFGYIIDQIQHSELMEILQIF